MIDTIILSLTKDMFTITNPEAFDPSAAWALSDKPRISTISSKQNPTKKELRNGIYKPRLTLLNKRTPHGGRQIVLKIELSLPKLLFGNNFAELRFKDFPAVIQKLIKMLESMGVAVTAQAVAQASVTAIHYSKNIKLTDGSIPYHYIQKIKEANVKLSLDVNQTDYRNEGHSYRWHCNAYEVVFYDKIKDLEHANISAKRSLEKDSALQLQLLKRFKKRKKKLEFLRMEVRLNKRQKMKQLFKKLGIKADLTFKKLFKPAISKNVLLHYLDELESRRPILLDYRAKSAQGLLADLIFNNPELGLKQILQLYGLKQALEVVTLRELRIMFSRYHSRTWYRLMHDAAMIKLPVTYSPLRNLRELVEKFEIVKY